MSETNLEKQLDSATWSEVLVQALPYFKQWVGKVVVVKYGGNAMLNEELKAAVMEDIVLLNTIGIHVVLVLRLTWRFHRILQQQLFQPIV